MELIFNPSNTRWAEPFKPGSSETNIRIPIWKDWGRRENRLLLVVQHIDGEDLATSKYGGRLMGNAKRAPQVYTNLLQEAQFIRNNFYDRDDWMSLRRDWAFAAVNFNNDMVYDQRGQSQYATHMENFADRVWAYIDQIRPTHVMIFGVEAYKSMLGSRETENGFVQGIPSMVQKSGWVVEKQIAGGETCKFTWTRAIDACYRDKEDQVNDSNALGMVCRHLANLLNGDHIVHIRDVKPNPVFIDSIGMFDALMERLANSKRTAVDTETNNLNRRDNQMLSIQFATDRETGFFLPMRHRETPFTSTQIVTIQDRLRNWFSEKFSYYDMENYLIMHNGRFDISVIRNDCRVPMIYREVWDTIAGEFCHDENYKFSTISEFKPYQLAQVTATYGHDYYFRDDTFSKGDRAHLKDLGLTPQVIEYGAFDVQAPFAIHECQQYIADHTPYPVGDEKTWGDSYRRLMLKQMSADVHAFAHMERKGVFFDTDYNNKLRSRASPYIKYLDERNKELAKTGNYKQAIHRLRKKYALPENSFDEDDEDLLDFKKREQVEMLFFEVMKLEPVEWDADGNPKTDEVFQDEYKDQCGCKLCKSEGGKDKECEFPEVRLYSEISVGSRIKQSFIDALATRMAENDDSRQSGRIHPDFNFQDIITGRGNCRNPSLQQTPQRGTPAKYVKRQFAARPGTLLRKADYSAHEVRMWGNAAKDKALTDRFWIGRELRKQFHLTSPLEEEIRAALKKEIKGKGDLHRFNYEFFFGVPAAEVTDDQRNGVKQIIFGAIYEKSIRSMAKSLGKSEEEVAKLYTTLFSTFHRARKYLDDFKEFAPENLFSYSRIGRQRHLPGYLSSQEQIISALDRRSVNAPIQGVSGDILHTALRITARETLDFVERFAPEYMEPGDGRDGIDIPGEPEAAVHDAQRMEQEYKLFVAGTQVMQWCMTGGVTNFYNKMFGFTWMVPTEIDVEVGFSESAMAKWDWYLPNLEKMTMKALQDQQEAGLMPDHYTPDKAQDEMWTFYYDHKEYLDKRYPFFFDWDYEKEMANAGVAWDGTR